jgi:hypothetical protein
MSLQGRFSEPKDDYERQGFFHTVQHDTARGDRYRVIRCPACGGNHPHSPDATGEGHVPGCWLEQALDQFFGRSN